MDKENVCIYMYTHTHTMQYYSAMKKEIMPFAATSMRRRVRIEANT